MKAILLFLLLFVLALSGCASPATTPDGDTQAARQALTRFFEALNLADYTAAAGLYGGSYETLATMNPDIPTGERARLWEQGCEFNGFQCLRVKEIVLSERVGETTFHFIVHFENADGTLFVQGPCCGEDETGMPPVSEFPYEVQRNAEGLFQVMDMPPYVP
jgi:hypothetical protein